MNMKFRGVVLAAILGVHAPAGVSAQDFAPGWTLQPEASALRFQSIKNDTKVESSSFATFSGGIEADGTAGITVLLDSVDTQIDLRNVRMRFLFFETFEHPEAKITLSLDPAEFADLATQRRKSVTVPFDLALHGVTRSLQAELTVTQLADGLVSVSSAAPVSISVADFGLEGGIQKLEEAAGVRIVPSATVTFDFLFARNSGAAPVATAAVQAPASAALEAEGDFSKEACLGRFEILSRTDNIYFRSGSAALDARSEPILNSIAEIVRRCPGLRIEVSGHTDADGTASANQRLSEARAGAVAARLAEIGIPAERMVAAGYGEARPAASNDTADGKRRNRRIEFAVIN